MKQRITPEQLRSLSKKAQKRLLAWWKPQWYDVYINLESKDSTPVCIYYTALDWTHGHTGETEEELKATTKTLEYLIPPQKVKQMNLPLLSIGQMIELLHVKRKEWFSQAFPYYAEQSPKRLCDELWIAAKEILEA